jgi:hypothetical protein
MSPWINALPMNVMVFSQSAQKLEQQQKQLNKEHANTDQNTQKICEKECNSTGSPERP